MWTFRKREPETLADGRYAVLQWTPAGGAAFALTCRSGRQTSEPVRTWTWPEDSLPTTDPERAGRWLREQLDGHQFKTTRAVVSLPHQTASLRVLTLPPLPADEQQQLIELQAESLQGGDDGRLCYDFQNVSRLATEDSDTVVLSCAESHVIHTTEQMCRAAGMSLHACSVGAFELPALDSSGATGTTLWLQQDTGSLCLMVTVDGVAIRAMSLAASSGNPRRVVSAATRLLASLPATVAADGPGIRLCGRVDGSIQQQLEHAFTGSDVKCVTADDPLEARAVAASVQQPDTGFNFVRPGHRRSAQQQRWAQLRRMALGAGLLCGLLLLWNYDQHQRHATRLSELSHATQRQTELNARGQTHVRRWQYVADWQASSVDWTDVLHDLHGHFPEPGDGYLTRLQLDRSLEADAPTVQVDGLVTSSEIAMQLNRTLMESGRYSLRPQGIEPAPHDAEFHSTYRIEAAVTRP